MSDNKQLCTKLLRADSEDTVINILKKHDYWDKPEFWRHYGDVENNWGQSGNQQSLAEAALAEKIVNSVDARLINECRMRGIEPSSPKAPQTIRIAVAQFFENQSTGEKIATGGYIADWGEQRTREIAEGITLVATGLRPEQLNITISDCGEGQSPDRIPETILSLSKSNKQYIAFVQGQFNQGGTGALRFCGKHNLQLVISKRNPAFLGEDASAQDQEWGFTIVRRKFPTDEPGSPKNSAYIYLAPVGVGVDLKLQHGGVLSFVAESYPIYPDDVDPYGREAPYGTAIKMYEYRFHGERSNILRGQSLRSRLDLLLPEVALPVRLFEYRKNKAGKYLDVGSRRTTLSGLLRRIKGSKNVEKGFPVRIPFQPEGEKLIANVFAFVPEGSTREGDDNNGSESKKLGGVRGYRKREGVVFLRNGQTQGHLPKDFFGRDAVKMKPLKDDLLVFVECDELSNVTREDLFMPSRDRLTDNEFKQTLVASLEKTLRDCQELKELRNKRQKERMQERLQDDRPLTDVLQSLIKNSPNLTTLLNLGQRISSPFNTEPTGSDDQEEFKGEFYPTFFKNKAVEYGQTLNRNCPVNHRMRLTFETDAHNDYFTRVAERGNFDLTWKGKDGIEYKSSPSGPTLKNGIATVMVDLPDIAHVGDEIEFIARIHDFTCCFENRIKVTVEPETKKHSGGGGGRKPPKDKEGADRERPSELDSPNIKRVYRSEWETEGFDEFTAMKIKSLGYTDNESAELYEFKVNMDNMPLENEAKLKQLSNEKTRLLREQFLYANVLVGLSLLLEDKRSNKPEALDEGSPTEIIEDRVESTCRALAPFMPALILLGFSDLDIDESVEGLEESA